MISLGASKVRMNPIHRDWILFIASFGIAAGLVFAPMPADAAYVPQNSSSKIAAKVETAMAAKDVEETGSIGAQDTDTSTCSKSRKRLFVEGEGWIVRKLTTCY